MSRENVEVVRRVYEAAARRDRRAVLALYDPDVEWDASRTERGALTGPVVRGHEDVRKWWREWYGGWEAVQDIPEELIDAGEDTVVSVMAQRGRGRVSGIEVEDRVGGVWKIRDGKVLSVVWFPTVREALEAVGLRE